MNNNGMYGNIPDSTQPQLGFMPFNLGNSGFSIQQMQLLNQRQEVRQAPQGMFNQQVYSAVERKNKTWEGQNVDNNNLDFTEFFNFQSDDFTDGSPMLSNLPMNNVDFSRNRLSPKPEIPNASHASQSSLSAVAVMQNQNAHNPSSPASVTTASEPLAGRNANQKAPSNDRKHSQSSDRPSIPANDRQHLLMQL